LEPIALRIGYQPVGAGWIEYGTGYQPTLNAWNHYAFVLNTDDVGAGANTAKLYVNGVEVFSGAANNPIFYNGIHDALVPYPLLIGGEFENNNPQWGMQGQADEVSIYSRALSQAEIFEIVRNLNQKEGVSILLAEQNTNVALKYADYGYILESGRIVMDGPARALAANKDVKEFYLGLSSEGRKSFRGMKTYRRRKRWL
jgi:hypothetical protein